MRRCSGPTRAPSQPGRTVFVPGRLGLLVLLFLAGDLAAQAQTQASGIGTGDLHERLTEREDENRLLDPRSIDFMGRPLTLSGQLELSFQFLGHRRAGGDRFGRESLLLAPNLEAEAFYSVGERLSLFAQLQAGAERQLFDGPSPDGGTTIVERGEMWLNSRNIAGSGLDLELGRLDFEDDRLWWWDADLDALRISHEGDNFEVALAVARELAPARSDRNYIEAEHNGVRRVIFEASVDWWRDHSLQLFALLHKDRSPAEVPESQVLRGREDESDARLAWIGLRASGARDSSRRGALGYWLDVASVRGHEWCIEYREESPEFRIVDARVRKQVRGWAFDAGTTWILPAMHEPRISIGFARGSGDDASDDRRDHSFRQTGLQGNEIGFGGVRRFGRYGQLLEPELSNLSVLTAGLGISLLQSSSLDLLYHRYRLVEAADSLRNANIDAELTGSDRGIGDGVDLVVAVEEWKRFEFELSASAFRRGRAFGSERGNWTLGAFAAVRLAF